MSIIKTLFLRQKAMKQLPKFHKYMKNYCLPNLNLQCLINKKTCLRCSFFPSLTNINIKTHYTRKMHIPLRRWLLGRVSRSSQILAVILAMLYPEKKKQQQKNMSAIFQYAFFFSFSIISCTNQTFPIVSQSIEGL